MVEVKLCNDEDIKETFKKLLNLSKDIDINKHPRPAFLMVITATKKAHIDENDVYIVPLCCLKK